MLMSKVQEFDCRRDYIWTGKLGMCRHHSAIYMCAVARCDIHQYMIEDKEDRKIKQTSRHLNENLIRNKHLFHHFHHRQK